MEQIKKYIEIGARLRIARESLGIQQNEFAKALNLKRTAYTNYEAGYRLPPPHVLEKILFEFGISADYILFGYKKNLNSETLSKIIHLESLTNEAHVG